MKKAYKTNLNCGGCVAKVRPLLDAAPGVARWSVDTDSPDKVLTVEGDRVDTATVERLVGQSGFRVLGELPAFVEPAVPPAPAPTGGPPVAYYPLVLLVAYLVGAVALAEVRAGQLDWGRAMANFMGGFFLAFSFFKLLDLRGFADSYRTYDLVAAAVPAYGYVYPFVELLLGVSYLAGTFPVATNAVTLVVMIVGTAGVVRSLLAGRKVRCACLGTVFNLPMSTVTLAEDVLMAGMAAAALALPAVH
jgi:copper chaperone CopZ